MKLHLSLTVVVITPELDINYTKVELSETE